MATPKKYEHIDFTPPKSVAKAAEKGLELRAKASPSNRGGLTPSQAGEQGIGSGVQRAVNLKNRTTMSPKVVKQMKAFFARHEKNKGVKAENKGQPWNDKGYVAWLLWGGDPGKTWAEKVVGQMEKADEKEKAQSKKASDNVPNDQKLWDKVIALTKGERKSLSVGGKTVNAPNDGSGFTKYPSAYANGWASKTYKDLGGTWSKKADDNLLLSMPIEQVARVLEDTERLLKSRSVQRVASLYLAKGKAKKDVGKGGLDEWFSGHGQGKNKQDGSATWGDWVAISPVKRTITKEDGSKKTYEPGDIIGPCGSLSDDPNWKDLTNNGKSPFKCMARPKAHKIPKKERAELAKNKQKAEKGNNTQKPTNTPTFKKEKKAMKSLIQRVASRYIIAMIGGFFVDRSTRPSTMYLTDDNKAVKLETKGKYKGKFVPCDKNEIPVGLSALPVERDWNGIIVSGNPVSEIASILNDRNYQVVAPALSIINSITFSNPFDPKEEWNMAIGMPLAHGQPTGIPSIDKKGATRNKFETYHKTYTSAMQEAYDYAEKNGYLVDEEDIFQQVTTGSGKPRVGETRSHSLGLWSFRTGKKQRKALQVQVYAMESGTYELNAYIL